jgi:hypothetical protein
MWLCGPVATDAATPHRGMGDGRTFLAHVLSPGQSLSNQVECILPTIRPDEAFCVV